MSAADRDQSTKEKGIRGSDRCRARKGTSYDSSLTPGCSMNVRVEHVRRCKVLLVWPRTLMVTDHRQARKARMAWPADSRLLHQRPHEANEALEGATGWSQNAQPAKGMGPVSVPSYSAFMRCALNLPMGAHRSSEASVAACAAQLHVIPGMQQNWLVSLETGLRPCLGVRRPAHAHVAACAAQQDHLVVIQRVTLSVTSI